MGLPGMAEEKVQSQGGNMTLTKKQILEIRNGEISICQYCHTMTKTILKKDKLLCGKCGRKKE